MVLALLAAAYAGPIDRDCVDWHQSAHWALDRLNNADVAYCLRRAADGTSQDARMALRFLMVGALSRGDPALQALADESDRRFGLVPPYGLFAVSRLLGMWPSLADELTSADKRAIMTGDDDHITGVSEHLLAKLRYEVLPNMKREREGLPGAEPGDFTAPRTPGVRFVVKPDASESTGGG